MERIGLMGDGYTSVAKTVWRACKSLRKRREREREGGRERRKRLSVERAKILGYALPRFEEQGRDPKDRCKQREEQDGGWRWRRSRGGGGGGPGMYMYF
jgi:hypothetical protein